MHCRAAPKESWSRMTSRQIRAEHPRPETEPGDSSGAFGIRRLRSIDHEVGMNTNESIGNTDMATLNDMIEVLNDGKKLH